MIRHYRWKPDTCGCQVNETHDTDTDEFSAEETYVNPQGVVYETVRCEAHNGITDAVDLYGVLHKNPDGENRVKNLMEKHLLEDQSLAISEEVTDAAGKTSRRFKEGIKYDWKFEGKGATRKLKVEIKGISLVKAKKDSIKEKGELLFGTDKIEIV